MITFLKKPFISEMIGAALLTALLAFFSPNVAQKLSASERFQQELGTSTIAEYVDMTGAVDETVIEYSIRSLHTIVLMKLLPTMFEDAVLGEKEH